MEGSACRWGKITRSRFGLLTTGVYTGSGHWPRKDRRLVHRPREAFLRLGTPCFAEPYSSHSQRAFLIERIDNKAASGRAAVMERTTCKAVRLWRQPSGSFRPGAGLSCRKIRES